MGAQGQSSVQAIHPVRIFQQGAALWQQKFGCLSAVFLVFYVPMFLVSLALVLLMGPRSAPAPAPAMAWLAVIVQLLQGAAGLWAMIALMRAAAQEKAEPLGTAVMAALTRFWPYVGASMLIGLIMLVPNLFLGAAVLVPLLMAIRVIPVIPALSWILMSLLIPLLVVSMFLSLKFSFFGFACVLEQAGPTDSLKRSWALTRKKLAPILGVWLLVSAMFFVLMIPAMVAGFVGGQQPGKAMQMFLQAYTLCASFVAVPLQTCVLLKLYRTLKEAAL